MNIRTIIFLFLIVFLSACEDGFLDQKPITEPLTEEVFASQQNIELLLSGAYQPMRWEFVQRGDSYAMPYIYTDVRSDDVVIESYFFQPHSHCFETLVDMTPANINVDGIWFKLFSEVSRANEIIRGLENLPDGVLDASIYEEFLGEAKFLRGYYYFELVKNFGDLPLFGTEPIDATDPEAIARKPAAMVYEQIIQDFTEAASNLPTTPVELGRATKGAALGLLAKVYLYTEQWQLSANTAQEVIDLGIYALEEQYEDNFKLSNEFGIESLFEINYTNNALFGSFTKEAAGSLSAQFYSPNFISPVLGWNYNLPTKELQDAFFNEGDQVRRKATILMEGDEIDSEILRNADLSPIPAGFFSQENGINDPNGGTRYGLELAYSKKYFLTPEEVSEFSAGFQLSPLNHKVMRYSELLLILAEAVTMGASGNGQAAFDQVRERVGLATKPLTLDNLKLERRLELATEWNRFHDLVRWGDAAKEIDNFTVGRDELLPIPFTEIQLTGTDANGLDIISQNPGY